jgi:prepilin-type N-terminal cleavage/methylation domain-containing protein/prepilin-type processing-associated H-X9-DG protein
MNDRRNRRGLTLIELLVVIAIMGSLTALLLPAVQISREAARSAQCRNHLRQVGLALHAYHDALGSFPMGYVSWKRSDPYFTSPGWGWAAKILPHLEQAPLFDSTNYDLAIEHGANSTTRLQAINTYICPSDRNTGRFTVIRIDGSSITDAESISYAGNFGGELSLSGRDTEIGEAPDRGNGLFLRNLVIRLEDVTDGASRTFAVGERGSLLTRTAWAGAIDAGVCTISPNSPSASEAVGLGAIQVLAHADDFGINDPSADPDNFFSAHGGGAYFLMVDGSVQFIRQAIDLAIYRALSSRNGGEVVTEESPN